jgi:hypothetical protein
MEDGINMPDLYWLRLPQTIWQFLLNGFQRARAYCPAALYAVQSCINVLWRDAPMRRWKLKKIDRRFVCTVTFKDSSMVVRVSEIFSTIFVVRRWLRLLG